MPPPLMFKRSAPGPTIEVVAGLVSVSGPVRVIVCGC